MVKINEDVFKRATDDANLKTKESPTSEKTQRITIYEVPTAWVEIIKNNKVKLFPFNNISAYAKQALIEKMERDGLIE
jgi:hypothetical protein